MLNVSGVATRGLIAEVTSLLAHAERLDAETRADAGREARLLAAGVLELSPGALAARFDRTLPGTQVARIRLAAARRARGEPLAYCVGLAPFRHLVLAVDERVLIPRPETEIVVEEALRVCAARPGGLAVDIGTGSGAIAFALATEGRFDEVLATDISADALEVARANVARVPHGGAHVTFVLGADFAPVAGRRARVIVANPPYISFHEASALPASVRDWEPATALFASADGMARYDVLLAGAPRCLEPAGWLVLEVDAGRAFDTRDRALRAGYDEVQLVQDLSGRPRVLLARASDRHTQRSYTEAR